MPRKLGQHFLRAGAVDKLLRVIAPAPGEVFLEIGPGRGALTLPLAQRCARIVAVELDAKLAERLRAEAPPNVEIVTADALEADLRALIPAGSRLVGNLPYYVSSPLMRRFRYAQLVSASVMAFSHGSNDAQKTMGVITLALFAGGAIPDLEVPFWVKVACAFVMGAGTYSGGKRIIHSRQR